MPDIVDLKRTPEDKKEIKKDMESGFSESDYPYGLSLHISDVEIVKLGIGALNVGDDVAISGTARISAKSMSEVEGGKTDGHMNIQVTGLAVEKAGKINAAKALYGDSGNDDNKGSDI